MHEPKHHRGQPAAAARCRACRIAAAIEAIVAAAATAIPSPSSACTRPRSAAMGSLRRASMPGRRHGSCVLVDAATGDEIAAKTARMHRRGLFVRHGLADRAASRSAIACAVSAGRTRLRGIEDPYRFPPVLGELDIHLLAEGNHRRLYEQLGAHPTIHRRRRGRRLRGVGAECAAGQRRRRLQRLGRPPPPDAQAHRGAASGRSSCPGVGRGAPLQIRAARPRRRAPAAEGRPVRLRAPEHAAGDRLESSQGLADHAWHDGAWMAARARRSDRDAPISIYEVHLGSWRAMPKNGVDS